MTHLRALALAVLREGSDSKELAAACVGPCVPHALNERCSVQHLRFSRLSALAGLASTAYT